MTVLEFYEHVLTELNKVEAPSLLLEDFNYFANKAVQQYINEVYNRYDINQQTTDDLRALKTSAQEMIENTNLDVDDLSRNVVRYFPGEKEGWYAVLPDNYLHMLNCVVTFKKTNDSKTDCSTEKSQVHSMARRLTSDMYPSILSNAYLKPSYKCPYYFINNTKYEVELNSAYKLELILNGEEVSDKPDSKCRIEIRCGDCSKYTPFMVYFDYIKTPSIIELTYEEIESGESTKVLEFPEYVCYEIVNRFVKLALENASDPRLETHFPINQTISGVSDNN